MRGELVVEGATLEGALSNLTPSKIIGGSKVEELNIKNTIKGTIRTQAEGEIVQ